MERSLINFVAFAPESYCDAVQDTLLDLGHAVNPMCGRDWLNAGKRRTSAEIAVTALLFGRDELPYEKIACRLTSHETPHLGIFLHDEWWQTSLAAHCNEFIGWPCQSRELALRLERLGAASTFAPINDADAPADDFLETNMIGRSRAFCTALSLIKKIARCDATVLIEGETGTGKEIAARSVHYLSARRYHPFISVNCGALPDELMENELYGHRKGAYTDARSDQPGLITQADGGTLFLDEVEALSAKGQVSLLRFLQDHEYRPLGSKAATHADLRVIAASNANLSELVQEGVFRQDLLYRLNLMPLRLPPLRERCGDAEVLAEYFLERYRVQYVQPDKYLHPDTLAWLPHYDWPGNVRELENTIHREFLLAENRAVYIAPLTTDVEAEAGSVASFSAAKAVAIAEFEKRYLHRLMEQAKGNVTHAAEIAGKERRALGKLLKKYGIDKSRYGVQTYMA